MDKQTAIDLLDNLLGMVEDNHGSDYDKAIHMGIDALKSNAPNALSALDCVARQAAIDEIEERKNANGYHNVALISELNRLEGYIMRLPSVQPQRWIPCSERNPDKDGRYLITGKMGTVYSLDLEDGRWYGGIKPIAWMPLPEPWREQE